MCRIPEPHSMTRVVSLLFCFSLMAASILASIAGPMQPKVIHARPANVSDDPAFGLVAKIVFAARAGGFELCSGTFVAPDKVLTAGHCACGPPETYQVTVEQPLPPFQRQVFRIVGSPILFDENSCFVGLVPGGDLALLTTQTRFACPATGKVIGGTP